MKRRTAGRVAKPRLCALCGGMMMASRPVFLVMDEDSRLVGPYHAGCAQQLAIAQKEIRDRKLKPAATFGRILHVAREETLPW